MCEFLDWDLINDQAHNKEIKYGIAKLNLLDTHPKYKVGQTIQFIGGYNRGVRFTSRITGFDSDGDIYVIWDCYWFPIRDEECRDIKIIEQ